MLEPDVHPGYLPIPKDIIIDDYVLVDCPAKKYFMSGVREDSTILYLQGGAPGFRSMQSHNSIAAQLAKRCDSSVNMLDFQNKAKDPDSTDLKKVFLAFKEMTKYTEARKIMIAGTASGGELVIAVMEQIRDQGSPMPGCGALMCPSSPTVFIDGAEVSGISLFRDLRSMQNLPPLMIQVADDQLSAQESTKISGRASENGVIVKMRRFEGMFHAFQLFTQLPTSQTALEEIGIFYKTYI